MLHPLGTSTWAWHTVIDGLSQHYTCYAFDMLGHGESDKPARHFNIPDYARALDDACQTLNIHRGHYVGKLGGGLPGHGNGGQLPGAGGQAGPGGLPAVESLGRQPAGWPTPPPTTTPTVCPRPAPWSS